MLSPQSARSGRRIGDDRPADHRSSDRIAADAYSPPAARNHLNVWLNSQDVAEMREVQVVRKAHGAQTVARQIRIVAGKTLSEELTGKTQILIRKTQILTGKALADEPAYRDLVRKFERPVRPSHKSPRPPHKPSQKS